MKKQEPCLNWDIYELCFMCEKGDVYVASSGFWQFSLKAYVYLILLCQRDGFCNAATVYCYQQGKHEVHFTEIICTCTNSKYQYRKITQCSG